MRGPSSRRPVGLALAIGMLALVGLAAPAAAAPLNNIVTYYYDTFGNIVGVKTVDCFPPYFTMEGEVTPIKVVRNYGPCDG